MSISATLLRWKRRMVSKLLPDADMDDHEVEKQCSWNVSCSLAALSRNVLTQVPSDVAEIIRQAKSLHPQMAVGADRRDAQAQRGDNAPALDAIDQSHDTSPTIKWTQEESALRTLKVPRQAPLS